MIYKVVIFLGRDFSRLWFFGVMIFEVVIIEIIFREKTVAMI